MKTIKKTLFLILSALMLHSCYEPLDLKTDNIDKIEIPIKIAAPLMNGNLVIEFDSLFNTDELGNDIISYENGVAYFKYDTIIDFYSELSDFLTMGDVEFEDLTRFEEHFSLNFDMPDIAVDYSQDVTFNTSAGPLDTTISETFIINPQDTFRTKYGSNAIFVVPADNVNYRLDVLNLGDPINFELPFEVYRVDINSGVVNLYMDHSAIANIMDDYMDITPSTNFQYSNPPFVDIDTTFSQTMSIPIYKKIPQLPEGISVIAEVKIQSLIRNNTEPADSLYLNERYEVSSLDTAFQLNLADYYYYSETGIGQIDLNVKAYMEIASPKDTAVIPLPDTLYFGTYIEDLVFEHVVFNYGIDTAMSDERVDTMDLLSSIPNNLEIEGFRLFNPEMKIKITSNLGFPALFDINKLWFGTDAGPEFITDNGSANINIPGPTDPMDATQYIPANRDSIYLDSANSRLDEVELINIKNLTMAYTVVVNPEDLGHLEGAHNFFYSYADDIAEDMYDVKLEANIRVPFQFKFDKISYQQVSGGFDTTNTSSIDSMIYLGESDSISLNIKIWTLDFPFNAIAQFYFDKLDENSNLYHIDSMFPSAQTLLPSSTKTTWDTATWNLTIDEQKYESLKDMDSLILDISFSMDEDDFFQLEKGATTEVGYRFTLNNSSFVFDNAQ